MAFPYKKVLSIGATSGIGLEAANQLVAQGVNVIAVGRRQDRLDSFVAANADAPGKASGVALDISAIEQIPAFAQRIIDAHPDLDCVFLNAGVQYVMDFSKPWTVDLSKIQQEITINYVSMVALTHAFVPFFQDKAAKQEKVAFIYTTTSLMSLPYPMVLNYSASKAALHSFILSIREQFKHAGQDIGVLELVTPLVQTELHNSQPGWGPDFNPGMPVDVFVKAALDGFVAGKETVAVGQAKAVYDEFEAEKGRRVGPVWAGIRKAMGKAHTFD
ncbi:NADP-dependent dehydrogenase-like protein [Thermothelomyces heterothallicus CBS 203.75]